MTGPRPNRGGASRGALLLCLGSAALAHLALLGWIGPETFLSWQQERLRAPRAAAPVAVRVRQLTSAAAAEPAPPAPAPGPASAPDRPLEPMPQPTPAPAVPVSADVEPPVYVPRALLSVAPVARAPVLLEWPPNWPLRNSYKAILKLYLDEQGRVERVEPDGDAVLPGPLFEAARQAFVATGFTPGQLNGQAVKSWVRVEVSFETGPPASSP